MNTFVKKETPALQKRLRRSFPSKKITCIWGSYLDCYDTLNFKSYLLTLNSKSGILKNSLRSHPELLAASNT